MQKNEICAPVKDGMLSIVMDSAPVKDGWERICQGKECSNEG